MTEKTQIDLKVYEAEYKANVSKLAEKYGTYLKAPSDERFEISERLRAAYCLHANPDMPEVQVFKAYSVDRRVWQHFVSDAGEVETKRKMSRADKVKAVIAWASENVGKEVTLQTLIEEGDIAYSMAKKITEDRPDIFRKVKRGLFEIRDPHADRQAERASEESSNE